MHPSEIKIGQRYRWTGWEGFETVDIPNRQLCTEEELQGKTVVVTGILTTQEGIDIVFIKGNGIPSYGVTPATLSPLLEGESDEN